MQISVLSTQPSSEEAAGLSVFDSETMSANPELMRRLREGTSTADLAAPPVVLPDFCHKEKSEMPSSIAVATRGSLRPTLTDAALNCGMALAVLDAERPTDAAVTAFYRSVRERYPNPPGWRRELTRAEVVRAAVEGGNFAADRYGVTESDLDHVEERARLDIDGYGGAASAHAELPWMVQQLARLRFGDIGPSTHFLELQEVEEVLDPVAAAHLGIAAGQVTVQFHNGGGVLTSQLGELYARRKAASRQMRMLMSVQKPLTHISSARSVAQLRSRFEQFFTAGTPSIPVQGEDGRRVMLATRLAMNYGFAYRLATYATLRQIAATELGGSLRLVVDSPHNSIYEEEVGGAPAFVHRHNACRALPAEMMGSHPVFSQTGQPVLLPGTNRTSSYLCVPASTAYRSLYTACHGSGSIISSFERRGLSLPDPAGRRTLRFGYSDAAPREVPHLDDNGVNEALRILTDNGLVRPVARMRPFAVLT